jgi:hypothetical protein
MLVLTVCGLGAGLRAADQTFYPSPLKAPAAAPPPAAAGPSPSLDGLWRFTRRDGAIEYFEVFAMRRFTYRDSTGAAAAGDVEVDGPLLKLRARRAERDFRYEVRGEQLFLTSTADDPRGVSGDLGKMSPREGAPAVFERPGPRVVAPALVVESVADVAGPWRREPYAGRADQLELTAPNHFAYHGPGGLQAAGTAVMRGGMLELSAGAVRRAWVVTLGLAADGWTLSLTRAPEDQPDASGDLAEAPPRFVNTARYTRPLAEVTAADVTGRWTLVDDTGREHDVEIQADGQAVYRRGGVVVADGRWTVAGTRLELIFRAAAGAEERRELRVQALPGRLVLWRDETDTAPSDLRVAVMPPLRETHVLYHAR